MAAEHVADDPNTVAAGQTVHRLPLPATAPRATAQPDFLRIPFQEIEVSFDPVKRAVWCYTRPIGPPSITPTMIRELVSLHRAIQAHVTNHSGTDTPVRYFVQGSRLPGIYSMGGDLSFFAECVRHGEREKLRRYAYDCVDSVHGVSIGLDCRVLTIALVEGDALGGGLEGALSCNVVVAEKQAKLGLPEILFNSFPGMGAYSFLARRLGTAAAERMILSGRLYSADEMHEMALVDHVVPQGDGAATVQGLLSESDRGYRTREALYRVRQRVNPVSLQEMRDVTDIWVDTMMHTSDADLRRMELLQAAQVRRLARQQGVQSQAAE